MSNCDNRDSRRLGSARAAAQRVVPRVWLAMRKRLHRVHDLTVGQFYREVAKLGGFLGRILLIRPDAIQRFLSLAASARRRSHVDATVADRRRGECFVS